MTHKNPSLISPEADLHSHIKVGTPSSGSYEEDQFEQTKNSQNLRYINTDGEALHGHETAKGEPDPISITEDDVLIQESGSPLQTQGSMVNCVPF